MDGHLDTCTCITKILKCLACNPGKEKVPVTNTLNIRRELVTIAS